VFSTCIFCNRPLGQNEAIEPFPVGRRLAFDGEKGRLWVVCRKCERWNLTPLEERWEAIEKCERQFRECRLRMSTDNVGLAKLKEGLVLVRIGEPLRPEFAAWRYGDQFGRRRKRAIIWTTAGVAAFTAVFVGAAAAGVTVGAFGGLPQAIINSSIKLKVKTEDGRAFKLNKTEMDKAKLLVDPTSDGWTLLLKHGRGESIIEGPEAMRIAGLVLPKMNYMAGSKQTVQDAVEQIETVGDPMEFLTKVPHDMHRRDLREGMKQKKQGLISKLPKPTKLALEMALHEEQERRALAGELLDLEMAWRAAEEVAQIADDLLVPKAIEEHIERLKKPSGETEA
jgi:hypothetical protein